MRMAVEFCQRSLLLSSRSSKNLSGNSNQYVYCYISLRDVVSLGNQRMNSLRDSPPSGDLYGIIGLRVIIVFLLRNRSDRSPTLCNVHVLAPTYISSFGTRVSRQEKEVPSFICLESAFQRINVKSLHCTFFVNRNFERQDSGHNR